MFWTQITSSKTWRNCAWKTTSSLNPSAPRCSTEWVIRTFLCISPCTSFLWTHPLKQTWSNSLFRTGVMNGKKSWYTCTFLVKVLKWKGDVLLEYFGLYYRSFNNPHLLEWFLVYTLNLLPPNLHLVVSLFLLFCIFMCVRVFSSSRVQRENGSRNWQLGSAVTSHGPWIRSRAGRRKMHASMPSYWYHTHVCTEAHIRTYE